MTLGEISKGCKGLGVEIHPSYVSKLRRGERPAPSEELSRALATVTGGDPEELIRAGHYDAAPKNVRALMDLADTKTLPANLAEGGAELQSALNVPNAENIFALGRLRSVPVVATLHCREPYFSQDNILGYNPLDVAVMDVNDGDFVWVKVSGDSMAGAGIYDGSLVLVRLQQTVEDGEIAAICVDGEDATLKRVSTVGHAIILHPENPRIKPSTFEMGRIQIIGKAVKVVNNL